ncbi:MAG: nucleotidyltransferase domain-containing protein [Chloroflexi bacterium]|nr:nucleotidyltransferase domain-containing protein [Chloroflexota bacterium]
MSRKVKEKATSPVIDWATLRPTMTDTLLTDITRRIVEKFHPYKIVLFGSYAYGNPGLYSNVDLLVVMDSEEPMVQRIRHVTEIAKVRFLPMDVIVRTPAEIEERLAMGDFFIAEILEKGKVLYQRKPA